MAETSEKTGEKKLSVTPTKTLTLKGRSVEQGVVRQSFSHGRTKAVVVEKVKSRVPGKTKPDVAPATPVAPSRTATGRTAAPTGTPAPAAQPAPAAPKPSGVVLRTLTEEERTARARALGDARLREAEERKIAEEEARIQKERDDIERIEREAAEARKADEEKRRKHDAETKRKADEVVKKHFGGETPATTTAAATPALRQPGPRPALEAEEEEAPRPRRGAGTGPGAARPAPAAKPARPTAEKRRGRLTLVTALTTDEVRERSVASFRRRTQRLTGHRDNDAKDKLVREVTIPEFITIQELANRMAEPSRAVIALLMKQGQMLKITDTIDADTAQIIAEEMGHTVKRVAEFGRRGRAVRQGRRGWLAVFTASRSSPSWAMSTTARRRCSMPSDRPTWCRAKPAALPSISAPIR